MPIVIFFIMLFSVFMSLIGHRVFLPELLEVCGGFYIVNRLSLSLGFCFCHRVLIYYSYLITVCIWVERYIGFGDYLMATRWITFLLGIIIMILFIWAKVKKNCKLK